MNQLRQAAAAGLSGARSLVARRWGSAALANRSLLETSAVATRARWSAGGDTGGAAWTTYVNGMTAFSHMAANTSNDTQRDRTPLTEQFVDLQSQSQPLRTASPEFTLPEPLGAELMRQIRRLYASGFEKWMGRGNAPGSSKSRRDEAENSEDRSFDQKEGSPRNSQRSGGSGSDNDDDDDEENTNQNRRRKKKRPDPDDEPDWDKFMESEAGRAAAMLSGALAIGLMFWLFSRNTNQGQEISYQEFRSRFLENRVVDKVVVKNKNTVQVYLGGSQTPQYFFSIGNVENFERRLENDQWNMGFDPRDFVPIQYSEDSGPGALQAISTLIWIALGIAILRSMNGMRGGAGGGPMRNIFKIGEASPTIVTPADKIKTTFKDVAGLDEAKVEVMEFVQFLKNPSKFTRLGARVPKGALLVGPPGTGKTLLAKAVAGEASVPFLSMSGSDFLEMFVGVGPSRVRDLFKQARKQSPCIIFIDEIDAVGRSRSKGGFSGGNDERENTLNQLLVEMDGFNTQTGVIVLAGTNRADILDQALLRPGRFDRQIYIAPPDIKGRVQIFEVHLKPLKLASPISDYSRKLAALSPGFSGADIANVCNEAALIAARKDKQLIDMIDFEQAMDRVIGGLEKKNKVMTQTERKTVAYHEAGHAVVGWFLEHANPLLKVTIVPRGEAALGYAQYLPKELSLYTKEQIFDMMCTTLGGRASEQIFFSSISNGAADDLKKITQLAYHSVAVWGMSDAIGNVSFHSDEQSFTKPFSEHTAQLIDEEIKKLVATAYESTVQLLNEKKLLVQELAERLLAKETINHDDLVEVLGERPFQSSREYSEFINGVLGDDTASPLSSTHQQSTPPNSDSSQSQQEQHQQQQQQQQQQPPSSSA